MKNSVFFIQHYFNQMKKKWWKLLLLFAFPVVFIAFIAIALMPFILPDEQPTIDLAIVNEDVAQESEMLMQLLELALKENEHVNVLRQTKTDALNALNDNERTAVLIFPANFTANLFEGTSVELQVIGNSQQKTESRVIKELVETIARHISSAQANILTVYHYAKQTTNSEEELAELQLSLLMDFTFYTLGKDNSLREETLVQAQFEQPLHYFGFAIFYCLLFIWTISSYFFLASQTTKAMQLRLKVLGVQFHQQQLARVIVVFLWMLPFASLLIIVGLSQFEERFYAIDYVRIIGFIAYLIVITCFIASIVEMLIPSTKMMLVTLLFVGFALIATSGALLPTIYLPYSWQGAFPYFYTFEIWQWLSDILFEQRNYASYTKITAMLIIISFIYSIVLVVKARWAS